MADRFYLNCPLVPGQVELRGPEAHHLAVVCRLGAGDAVCLFNGDGFEYPARVISAERRLVKLEVESAVPASREPALRVEVAAPVPKGDRAQFLIEKLTELGVASFVPLETERSVIDPGKGKLEKLQRVVIESSKQCGRNVLLQVMPPTQWRAYCKKDDLPATKIVAHPGGADPWPSLDNEVALAVGPEGGFTEEEIEGARVAGWQVVALGPRTLRIETAAILLASWALLKTAD
jgi:16S rRNA (uracil1498-N3)-methyltransferase